MPTPSGAQEAHSDSVWAAGYRSVLKENRALVATVDSLRVELVRQARHHEIDLADKDRQISWLEDQRPRFYERPQFLVPVIVAVTVWATLQVVRVSL